MNSKIVQIQDCYFQNQTVTLRVTPVEIDEEDRACFGGHSHMATISEGQIAKLKRELPNGPAWLHETEIDRYTGKPTAAEIHFSL